jgi:DNA-binding transcriptional MerR regulator
MYTIGEFSRITGLTVKTLRFYHEEGLLEPASIDPQTGYRHYDRSQIDTARVISYLTEIQMIVES